MTDKMRVWSLHDFGDEDKLSLEDIDRPNADDEGILVRIRATSVNPVDFKTRQGKFPPVEKDDLPKILGRDVAGIVETERDKFEKGDRVFGMPAFDRGTYAEYIVMKPSELAHIPEAISFNDAAGLPLAALTAWQGLFDHGDLKDGERVLILGAPGGVGHLAVQFAKNAGAMVYATGRAEDKDFLESLGAEKALGSEPESLDAVDEPVDLILDLLGGEAQKTAWKVLKDNGRFISTLEEPTDENANKSSVKTGNFMAEPNSDQLAKIMSLVETGKVKLVTQRLYGFNDLPNAQRALENEHTQGKIIIEVS